MTRSLRTASWVLGLSLLARAAAAAAPLVAAASPDGLGVERAAAPAPQRGLPAIGVMADVGLPDGAGGSLVFRPTRWLRASAGGTYNLISSGLRAGATWLPFGWGPSLSLEGGHYFDGNANELIRKFAGADYQSNAVLQRVGYDYANAHLGLDLGFRRATFFIHAGVSFIRAKVHNLDEAINAQTAGDGSSSTTLTIKQDPIIRAFTPSAKLGLIVYLW